MYKVPAAAPHLLVGLGHTNDNQQISSRLKSSRRSHGSINNSNRKDQMKQKINLGEVFIHIGALARLGITDIKTALARFEKCDWGDIPDAVKKSNDKAIGTIGRVKAIYHNSQREAFLVFREERGDVTVIIMPQDYCLDEFKLKLELTNDNRG